MSTTRRVAFLVPYERLARLLPLPTGVVVRALEADLAREALRIAAHTDRTDLGPEAVEGAEAPLVNLEWQEAQLWRCATCGKWSHAQRRPLRHERRVAEFELNDADVILATDHDSEPDDEHSRPFIIACGPFQSWRAIRHPE